jgi:predicted ATPase/DNA-binding CsgD family transcriptional regulator
MRVELGNLPAELTSFIGRQEQVAQVKRLLSDARLVTLVGVGGTGKTRLALRVATELRRSFRDGTWLVELDKVSDEALVVPAVMMALGLRDQAQDSPTDLLRRHLAQRRLLLVLDNCEHLVGAVAKLAAVVLSDAAEVRILATSREPLAIAGETTAVVPPLSTPHPRRPVELAELVGYEAVTLFAERAAAVVPGFSVTSGNGEAVSEICRRLDGLPLAIELAAGRTRALAPAQIRDRLADRLDLLSHRRPSGPMRQQTLQRCIEWSYDLCTPAEQRLWARLSVFAGDVDLPAIDAVCAGDGLPADGLLDVVASLVDKSVLIRNEVDDEVGQVRYRMLETIRAFGRARLREAGEEVSTVRRHRDWFQALALQAEADWISPRQAQWLLRLERDLPDLRAALEVSLTEPHGRPNDAAGADAAPDVAADMGAALLLLWSNRGLQGEGRHWLGRILARPGRPTRERIKALVVDLILAGSTLDVAAAQARLPAAKEIAAELGEPRGHGLAAFADGHLATTRGDFAAAVQQFQAALTLLPAQDDVHWRVQALSSLTLTQVMLGDTAAAAVSHDALLKVCRPRGERWFSGFVAMSLGIERWKAGDLDRARGHLADSARLLRHGGNSMITSWCLEVMAWVAADQGLADRAARLLGAATALANTMDDRGATWPDLLTYHERCEQQTRDALGERAFRDAFAHGLEQAPDDAIAYALREPPHRPAADHAPDLSTGAVPTATGEWAGSLATLTRREREVAQLVAEGLTNKQIASRLVISPRTADGHVRNIMLKLGCTSRAYVATFVAAATT